MRNLLLAFVFVFAQAQAPATGDIITRPMLATGPVEFLAADEANIVTTCFVLCGADFLDSANHLDCKASGPNTVTAHTIQVPKGMGDVCVRGVSLTTGAVVSDPSEFSKTVQDVPGRPRLTQ